MPNLDQLEIIGPDGEIEFYELDPGKGTTNIGRHPDNDIVLDSPGIALFQAVLDHQRKPYRIMVLTEEADVRLGGQPLPANSFQDLHSWDSLEMDAHTLVLLESAGVPAPGQVASVTAATASAALAAGPAVAELREPAGAPVPTPAAAPAGMPAIQADRLDDFIVTELSVREWTINVDETAACQLTIVNGGNIVATFAVEVQGVDSEWVTINPPAVNLYEGGRAAVHISITPPREPSSRAGAHYPAIVVTSPNYPGHVSQMATTLTINPFYEFTVGELSPKQQTVSFRKRVGEATLPITNSGNSGATFRLEGEDDERGCRFEFQVPGEEARLIRQAELNLASEQVHNAVVQIAPIRRRLVALRSRQYSFTLTTSLVEGAQMPRSVMGRIKSTPLIGPLLILLILLLLATLVVILFHPVSEPALAIDTSNPRWQQGITLNYDALRWPGLPATNLLNHLNALLLNLTLEWKSSTGEWQVLRSPSELTDPTGSVQDTPAGNGRYRLKVSNLISQIIPLFPGLSREVPVYVTAVSPVIDFKANRTEVMEGEEVVLYWHVTNAESVSIEQDGIPLETLSGAELLDGQRKYVVENTTTFAMKASNSSGASEETESVTIRVIHPTATPVPPPVIIKFNVSPLEITEGDTVEIEWAVTGADTVNIEPTEQGLPLEGTLPVQPTELTNYRLVAIKNVPGGEPVQTTSVLITVKVNPLPTPTVEPVPPVIDVFEATPKEVVLGNGETVKLTYSVSGVFTKIEITNPDLVFSTNISRTASITVTPKETTLYVLTAYNGDLSASSPKEVTGLEPTPTPTPEPPPTPLPPPPQIISFRAEAGGNTPAEDVRQVASSDSVPTYLVLAGSAVKFTWFTQDATKVTFVDFGDQPPSDASLTIYDVTAEKIYQIDATNDDSEVVATAYLRVSIEPPPPPDPPDSVTGVEGAGQILLSWTYNTAAESEIMGFRIYRDDDVRDPDNELVRIAGPDDLPPDSREWPDPVGDVTCGKGYYVVSVYTDVLSGDELETDASRSSWYSSPCP
jgi:hypothetical protein